ncbi:MAG: LacI family DNA-binding transcriptional regulator [Acidobacteriota bacterium]|nr:LacI family DNA-binding transcriptional regulator [Acidobacteriota bacterium]
MSKKSGPTTLSEVARAAGVGTTTVSRVINGGFRVHPTTLARVKRVIEEMGYLPNHAARVLKGDRTKTIGIIVPSIADPFFSSCAEAAQAVARANDSLLIVTASHNDPHIELENVNILLSHRVDGLILAPANSRSQALREILERLSIPVLTIDRPISNSSIPSVLTNNFKGARIATQHLIEHGYKRIVCLTGESTLYTIQERMRGYRAAMEAAGLPEILNTSIKDYKSAEYAIESLLAGAEPPDAIFTLKNSSTIFAFEALQKNSVAVPKTVALLGFDDFELASTLKPSITVVQQPVEEIGRVTAEILFEQLLGKDSSGATMPSKRTRQVMLETLLIQRASCGCMPAAAAS